MSIPMPQSMGQEPVTWTLAHTTGKESLAGARGFVRFEPTAVAVAFPSMTVLPRPVEARVVAGVMEPVDLLVNDPELWNWRVTPEVGVPWPSFHVDVPVGGVDLATAVVVPGIGPIRAVTGPPGTTAWADLTGKPATYPSTVADVDGLVARLAALEQDTGLRDVREEFPDFDFTSPGGHAHLSRIRSEVFLSMNGRPLETAAAGMRLEFSLPHGFRGVDYGLRGIARTGTLTGAVGSTYRVNSLNPQIERTEGVPFQMLLHFRTSEGWPTTLPGDPA